jgi:poly(A) polymerase
VNARLDPAKHAWMIDGRTRAVIAALTAQGGEARFVGGAVRNALLGEPVSDVDIATPLTPDEVIGALEAAALAAIPTGLAHGTVTAVAGRKPFEITTLRRDVETFGRHAAVAYTMDWAEDARRRDFTMNALYADAEGRVYDYNDGLADLAERRVRFVGDARTRIREDYLRILRLFRFHAWFGRGAIDEAALAACVAEKAGLAILSGERIQKELLRLLEAKEPVPALGAMVNTGILVEIVPSGIRLDPLARLVAIDASEGLAPDPVLRLAATLPAAPKLAAEVAARLKLSNVDRDRLIGAASPDVRIRAGLTEQEARQILYRLGPNSFRDQLILQWADEKLGASDSRWRDLLALTASWRKPSFPLDGDDVMALGIDEGPKIGALLRDLETWWIEADFVPDRAVLLARLQAVAQHHH